MERINVKQNYQILGLQVMLVVLVVFGVSKMVKECMSRTAPYPGSLFLLIIMSNLIGQKEKA